MSRVVAVLGGNAFAAANAPLTMESQIEFAHRAAERLMPLFGRSSQLLISHGNGPQVGHILRRVEAAVGESYRLPLDVCVAESEGELGFVLGQALRNVARSQGIDRDIVSMLTQVIVDRNDPAFGSPAKPIGPVLKHERVEKLRRAGVDVLHDVGRGYRRVVASPRPMRVIEMQAIRVLLDAGQVVIAAGGGGIPVVESGHRLVGVEAVIDKDLTGQLLADELGAESLVIVTCVPCAYLSFNTDQQAPIERATATQMQQWLDQGHFAPGSMQPKVEAAIQFTAKPGRRVIICDVESLPEALEGKAGTIIESSKTAQAA